MDKKMEKNGLSITESLNIMSQQSQTNSALNQVLVDATNESLRSLGNINKDIENAIIPISQALSEMASLTDDIVNACHNAICNANEQCIEALKNTLSLQNEVFVNSSFFASSKEIEQLVRGLSQNKHFDALANFTKVFDNNTISGQDLAFLKLTNKLDEAIHTDLRRGIPSTIKAMNIGTAHGLSKSLSIEFDRESKSFFDKAAPENIASVDETNIIFSGLQFLSELSAEELFDFLNYIKEYPFFASKHYVGRKILRIIGKWESFINFDKDKYYHARTRKNDAIPYTDSEMCRAPTGLPLEGRYNLSGQSHYYFSNLQKGAVNETRKHCSREMIIQVAQIKPNCTIKMIDLSSEYQGNKFLEYCRYQFDSTKVDHLRSEYLIPSYVASCCKLSSIDGIKYYGSSEYDNYVTWKDHYFDFVSHELNA